MFTGIIQGLGRIVRTRPLAGEVELTVEAEFDWDPALVLGESIAVSGCCLTVTRGLGRVFSAHVSGETLSKTVLGDLNPGDRVNLERALRLSDRLGGHLVSGHVDDLGRIVGLVRRDRSLVFTFELPEALASQVIEKGSIAVDGISLTINQVLKNSFTVNVIPHTAAATTLGFKKIGDPVNLETDLIGKYVARFLTLNKEGAKIDKEFLAQHGFL